MPRTGPYGNRVPLEGDEGMAMSMYVHRTELKMLDELRRMWGLKRNSTLRRLIVEGYQREVDAASSLVVCHVSPVAGGASLEIMVLTMTFVVSFSLMATGATIAIIEIRNPDADTDGATETLFTAITIIIGALLGLLAAKPASTGDLSKRPGETKPSSLDDELP